jgi:hypothetical protein
VGWILSVYWSFLIIKKSLAKKDNASSEFLKKSELRSDAVLLK